MKNRILLMLTISIFNSSFTMEAIKSFFGFASNKQSTELQRLWKQLKELENIAESLFPIFSAAYEAYFENCKKCIFWWHSGGFGDNSRYIVLQYIFFGLSEKNGIINFSIKNNLIDFCPRLIGEIKLDKTLFDNVTSNLLYSHLLDVFDALIEPLIKNECQQGFVKYLSNPTFSRRYPITVANLKPQPIEQSESLAKAVERLNAVIIAIGKPMIERIEQIDEANKRSSD